jgi:hypothetical protein
VVLVADLLLLWFQWLTLAACVLMWGPCLTELLLSKWELGENYTNMSQCFFSVQLDLDKKTQQRYIIQSMFHVLNKGLSCLLILTKASAKAPTTAVQILLYCLLLVRLSLDDSPEVEVTKKRNP